MSTLLLKAPLENIIERMFITSYRISIQFIPDFLHLPDFLHFHLGQKYQ